jgi:hypothetical protein
MLTASCALALAVLGGCAVVGPHTAGSLPDAWQQALGAPRALVAAEDVPAGAGLVVVDANWRLPNAPPAGDELAAARSVLGKGGRVVLFGHAARLAAALGADDVDPVPAVYRWGHDARAARGEATLALGVVSGRLPELFEGLTAVGGEDVFPIVAGTPCTAAVCAWTAAMPRRGDVLARLVVHQDGVRQPNAVPIVVRWQVGRGELLAVGLAPAVDHDDATVRANASRFVAQCRAWASCGAASRPVFVAASPDRTPPPLAAAAAPDGPPIVPELAHWGWRIEPRTDGRLASSDAVLGRAVLPSWLAGSDLCELELLGTDGLPVPWSDRDRMRRPESFRSDERDAPVAAATFAALAREAHARSMLVAGSLPDLPVGGGATERLVALRFVARELLGLRRLGAAALDAVALGSWWPDGDGFALAMVQDHQPAARLYKTGERVPPIAGAARAVDAEDGALPGGDLVGVTARWRPDFPADEFVFGVLDARTRPETAAAAAGPRGGGSTADWLVAQFHDFVRPRRFAGAAAVFRRHDPRTLGPDTVDYVHALGLEGLRAALAMPLAATGLGGWRAAAHERAGGVAPAFADGPAVPCAVHVLQNNHFRLEGTGGALFVDATGTARFLGAEVRVLSPAFLQTRIVGGRPDASIVAVENVDLLATGRLPRLLTPAGPAGYDGRPAPGLFELELTLRAEAGSALLTIHDDGVLLRCIACAAPATVRVPVHVATGGPRRLDFAAVDGDVRIDRAVLQRAAEVAVESRTIVPGGAFAAVAEVSQSSQHHERIECSAVADAPLFVARVATLRAERNVRVERRLDLPRHRRLVGASTGQELRRAFVLVADDESLPDVVVLPLRLARYEHFRVDAAGLSWRNTPEVGVESVVAFAFPAHGQGEAQLDRWQRCAAAVAEPAELRLPAGGATSVVTDLPVAWTRVLRLPTAPTTPLLVRERGWWTWRGTQVAPGGGAFVRVHHEPGDAVQVVGGPAVLARTRPGPGALRTVALREPLPDRATVRVLQESRLAQPSIVFATDFDRVTIDGEPWSWCDGRTVFLPNRTGTYEVVTTRGGGERLSVAATAAPLTVCRYDEDRRELTLVAGAGARPSALGWTALLRGPAPTSIENGEVVPIDAVQPADASAAAELARGGTLIRFRSGVTRIRHGD